MLVPYYQQVIHNLMPAYPLMGLGYLFTLGCFFR